MYTFHLNNGDFFEIDGFSEGYNVLEKSYSLNFNIINNTLQLSTIINLFTGNSALDSIMVKDKNNKIIYSSFLYKRLTGASIDNNGIVSISIDTQEQNLQDPNLLFMEQIVEELKNMNEILKGNNL